ncbi:MAG: hypothetical protein V3U75_10665 [Methylococcaceae bacterium]
MEKYTRAFVVGLFFLTINTSVFAENRGVSINIGSSGSGDVSPTITTIRQIIGYAIGGGVVDKFIVEDGPIPIEGGLIACAESDSGITDDHFQDDFPSPVPVNKFEKFVKQLRSIRPDSGVFLNVKLIESCDIDKEPLVCTQDVKECPDGSFVSRQPPLCEFAPC